MKTTLHKTKNDLPEKARGELVELLNSRLATAIDLQYQAKQAHWNVKGPQFIALHELFDQVSETAESAVDEIAERAVQLGGVARGTVRIAAKESALAEYPLAATGGTEHVEALSTALAAFGSQVRAAITLADELGDAGTADLFTSLSQAADKQLWFVEAHLQAK
ncbi:MAG: DNA starvation/stationary phase protection protein Dps [Planctomycetes bacterium]|nr:DNA starvation/stationary phase protection protein Dps [Planctomycetota bacterium]